MEIKIHGRKLKDETVNRPKAENIKSYIKPYITKKQTEKPQY